MVMSKKEIYNLFEETSRLYDRAEEISNLYSCIIIDMEDAYEYDNVFSLFKVSQTCFFLRNVKDKDILQWAILTFITIYNDYKMLSSINEYENSFGNIEF